MDVEKFKQCLRQSNIFSNIPEYTILMWCADHTSVRIDLTHDACAFDPVVNEVNSLADYDASICFSNDGRCNVDTKPGFPVFELYDILPTVAKCYNSCACLYDPIFFMVNGKLDLELSTRANCSLIDPNPSTLSRYLGPDYHIEVYKCLPYFWKIQFYRGLVKVAEAKLRLVTRKGYYKFVRIHTKFTTELDADNKRLRDAVNKVCSIYLKVSNANLATDISDLKNALIDNCFTSEVVSYNIQ